MEDSGRKYSIQLAFEEIHMPPLDDILIVGMRSPQGKIGINKSFEILAPNEFEVLEINDGTIEAIFINKRILKKIEKEKIIKVLQDKVFPYVSEDVILKVDLKLKISYDLFEGDFVL